MRRVLSAVCLVRRCAQWGAASGLKQMTRRDGLLAVLLAVAMVGPWHTANRLSRLIAVTGACPNQWLTTKVLVGGITARALPDEHYGADRITGRALRRDPGDHQ